MLSSFCLERTLRGQRLDNAVLQVPNQSTSLLHQSRSHFRASNLHGRLYFQNISFADVALVVIQFQARPVDRPLTPNPELGLARRQHGITVAPQHVGSFALVIYCQSVRLAKSSTDQHTMVPRVSAVKIMLCKLSTIPLHRSHRSAYRRAQHVPRKNGLDFADLRLGSIRRSEKSLKTFATGTSLPCRTRYLFQ